MIFKIYDYTSTMSCPDTDYLPNIDNVVKAVRWSIKDNFAKLEDLVEIN